MRRASLHLLRDIALSFLLLMGSAWGEERMALVIGNATYDSGALANPVNDAQLLRDTLKADGFTVNFLANADRSQMVRAIQALGKDLAAGGKNAVGLFYFSGHGVQSDGHNFLLPVKVSINSDADLLPEAVDAEWVLKQMEAAHNSLDIVILDACRNNPLPVRMRDALKGLASMQAPAGSVVAFATDAGSVASDGSGHNSPYAEALARYMSQPGLELQKMFADVSQSVYEATKTTRAPQIPVQTYKLTPVFYFRGAAAIQSAPPPFQYDPRAAELALWQSAEHLRTAEAYRAYLAQYPRGQFSSMAQLQLAAVSRPAAGSANASASATAPASTRVCLLPAGDTQQTCERAMQGFADAQNNFGDMYYYGRGVPQSDTEAVGWYRKAVDQGNALGQANLGYMYEQGRGVAQSYTEAVKWYRLAADQGNAPAQANLGVMYEHGQGGLAPSDTEAVKWYRLAAEKGYAGGQSNLGVMYQHGRGGLAQSDAEAVKWLRLAADQGFAHGQFNLGTMYENGSGVPKDRAEAVKWYRLSAKQGDKEAQKRLQELGESSP
jgi:TPR repeat protein